jgi:hypothetical protein
VSSLYTLIMQETKEVLQSVSGLGDIQAIYTRKHPRLTKTDTLPAIILCPGIEKEYELHSENTIQYVYPVYASLWQAGNQMLEENMERMLDWREALRMAIHRQNHLPNLAPGTKPTVPWVIDGEVDFTFTFEPAVFNVDYDVSEAQILFLSEEARED